MCVHGGFYTLKFSLFNLNKCSASLDLMYSSLNTFVSNGKLNSYLKVDITGFAKIQKLCNLAGELIVVGITEVFHKTFMEDKYLQTFILQKSESNYRLQT